MWLVASRRYRRAYNVSTMRSKLVKIGNSQGVLIPKSMLDEAEIDGEIELRVIDGEIHISAVESETGMTFMMLSRDALSDWDRPEEDEAWARLQ